MQRIPILQMGEFLLVTIQVDMHDRLALALQDDLTSRIATSGARGAGILFELETRGLIPAVRAGEPRGFSREREEFAVAVP